MQIDKIDFVVTWVDSTDKILNERRDKYLRDASGSTSSRGKLSTRYANRNEVIYCLASILRNAAFANRIYLVTDGQSAPLENLRRLNFDDREISKIVYIDHREIFGDLIEYWPSFNSCGIESLLHRIPGLADHYVYMNDDFFILQPTNPDDYFWAPGVPIVNATIRLYWSQLFRLKGIFQGSREKTIANRSSFSNSNKMAALICDLKFQYLQLMHTPYPLFKPRLQEFFSMRPELLKKNLSFRFRSNGEFNPQSLAYCLALKEEAIKIAPYHTLRHTILKPKHISRLSKTLQISGLAQDFKVHIVPPSTLFLCVQSLDQVAAEDAETFLEFLGEILMA